MKNEIMLKGDNHPLRTFTITLGLSNGSKGVMFVLYSILKPEHHKSKYINPFTYLGQLSDNIDDAIIKARKRIGKFELKIWNEESFKRAMPLHIPFGKYKGMTIEQVYDIDPKYLFWMSNNTTVKSKKLTEKLSDYAQLSKELIIEENKNKTNDFLPFDIDKKTRVLYIYSVKEGNFGLITRMKDDQNNRYQYTGKDIGLKGENIEFNGKIKRNFSSMGLNFNILNLR